MAIKRGTIGHRVLVELAALNRPAELKELWENLSDEDGLPVPNEVSGALSQLTYVNLVSHDYHAGGLYDVGRWDYKITWQGVEALRQTDAADTLTMPRTRVATPTRKRWWRRG